LLEKQFAKKMGVKQEEIISIPLTPGWHRNLDNPLPTVRNRGVNIDREILTEVRKSAPSVSEATPAQIWDAHRYVYTRIGREDWAKAVYDTYFRPLGVPYK
jgi:hypothetical protein